MVGAAQFDAGLISRYEGEGPRYTSYPTAREFRADFDLATYKAEVASSNDDPIPAALSLYLHIPFCSSPCFYCGCTRIITRDPGRMSAYLDRLQREIALQAALFDRDRPVQQLHFGGGTPTYLSDAQLQELWQTLQRNFFFSLSSRREFSIEVDPRTVTPQRMRTLADLGFNRASFGIQDFNPEVQKAVNREQDVAATLAVLQAGRDAGFESLAVDLIYGLPKQTLEGFAVTLDTIVAARPDRVAVYAYAHLPEVFKAQRQIKGADLPGAQLRLELLGLAVERLTEAGYEYVGMDHFALPHDELVLARAQGSLQRNFQGYSTHAGLDLVGLGLSAIGHVGDVYVQNAKTLNEYYAALDAGRLPIVRGLKASEDDRLRSEVINRLMCYGEVLFRPLEESYQIRFRKHFAKELKALEPLIADGLAEVLLDRIRVKPRGRFLLRRLAMVFDAYRQQGPANGQFSKVL